MLSIKNRPWLLSRREFMRSTVDIVVDLLCWGLAKAQLPKLPSRYNLDYYRFTYSQPNPGQTLTSVIKTIKEKQLKYLLAHLTDPDFVDQRVREVHGGKFDELIK